MTNQHSTDMKIETRLRLGLTCIGTVYRPTRCHAEPLTAHGLCAECAFHVKQNMSHLVFSNAYYALQGYGMHSNEIHLMIEDCCSNPVKYLESVIQNMSLSVMTQDAIDRHYSAR